MGEKPKYFDCWTSVASSLFSQALAGEPVLKECLPKPMGPGSFGFAITLEGDEEGTFSVLLDGSLSEAPLLGEGVDQKAGWAELLKEIATAATGELFSKTARKSQVTAIVPITTETKLTGAFQLKAGERSWYLQVNSNVRYGKRITHNPQTASAQSVSASSPSSSPGPVEQISSASKQCDLSGAGSIPRLSPGLELLLDVELEASLRFGAREMPLGEILELGPGDVVQLDRHVNDPVELIVGDKIVARGEVVLIDGNFGLRVTEVAEPMRRLESIRCLF